MEFGWSQAELAYRDEVPRFLAEALPEDREALSRGRSGSDVRAVLDLAGVEALDDACRLNTRWRKSLWETLGGGTSEIMRSVVAKQVLGLSGRS